MIKTFAVSSVKAMQKLGKALANNLRSGDIVFLQGDLGAGKTTLARGILSGLGHVGSVKSPTYALVENYLLRSIPIFHFDLYRIKSPQELYDIGIEDYFSTDAIILVEWPEKALQLLPQPTVICEIKLLSSGREIKFHYNCDRGLEILSGV